MVDESCKWNEFEGFLPDYSDEEIHSKITQMIIQAKENQQSLHHQQQQQTNIDDNKEIKFEHENNNNQQNNNNNNYVINIFNNYITKKKKISFSEIEILVQQKLFQEEKIFKQQAENFLYELENRFRNSTSTPIESRNMLLMDIYQIVNQNKNNMRELEIHKQITRQICNFNEILMSNLIQTEKNRLKIESMASLFFQQLNSLHIDEMKERMKKEVNFNDLFIINSSSSSSNNHFANNNNDDDDDDRLVISRSKLNNILAENFLMKEKMEKMQEISNLRENHFVHQTKSKEIELQFLSAKFRQQIEHSAQQTLKLAKSYQQQVNLSLQSENDLRNQLKNYADKFEQFQETLLKSSEVFSTFKQEMERMAKTIKRLEKDKISLQKKSEQTDIALIEMAEQKNMQRKEIERLNTKIARLEAVCRLLQSERRKLTKQQSNSDQPNSDQLSNQPIIQNNNPEMSSANNFELLISDDVK